MGEFHLGWPKESTLSTNKLTNKNICKGQTKSKKKIIYSYTELPTPSEKRSIFEKFLKKKEFAKNKRSLVILTEPITKNTKIN